MNILNIFDHPGKKQNKEYFIQLVRSAKSDGIIQISEMELLHRIGKKLGFTDPEINNLIEETDKSEFIPPYELAKRFEQVYQILSIILADGKIEDNEMRIVNSFAVKSGFSEDEIPGLLSLMIKGTKNGIDEESLFEQYKIERTSGLK